MTKTNLPPREGLGRPTSESQRVGGPADVAVCAETKVEITDRTGLGGGVPYLMRAAVAPADSALADLEMLMVSRPSPVPGEVLIRVNAAGVNPVDVKSRIGRGAAPFLSRGAADDAFPWIPGWDVAGEVAETGRGVARFAAGDRVFGTVNFPRSGNGYAEYVVASVSHICRTPAELSDIEAAALPMAGLTAWQALVYAGRLAVDQRVLITAAAGGVGHLAVQIARIRGAHVVALASPANLEFVRGLGADEAVDRTRVNWRSLVSPVDLVLDMFGGRDFEALFGVIKPGGKLVTVASASLANAPGAIQTQVVVVAADGRCLHELADAATQGVLMPHVSAVLPLENAGRAHELIDGGTTRGKIVLDIAGARGAT